MRKLALLLCLLLAGPSRAEEGAVERTAKDVGHEVTSTARKVGDGVDEAANTVGHRVRDAAQAIGRGFSDAARAVTRKERSNPANGDAARNDPPSDR